MEKYDDPEILDIEGRDIKPEFGSEEQPEEQDIIYKERFEVINKPSIGIVTFNTEGVSYCDPSINRFTCKSRNDFRTFIERIIDEDFYINKMTPYPDIIAIGLQESKSSFGFGNKMIAEIGAIYQGRYKLVATESSLSVGKEGTVGLELGIYIRRELVPYYFVTKQNKIKCKYDEEEQGIFKRAYKKVKSEVGTKGAVSITLIDGIGRKYQFITTHLPYDYKKEGEGLLYRTGCFIDIYNDLIVEKNSGVKKHVFLFGDMNFRNKGIRILLDLGIISYEDMLHDIYIYLKRIGKRNIIDENMINNKTDTLLTSNIFSISNELSKLTEPQIMKLVTHILNVINSKEEKMITYDDEQFISFNERLKLGKNRFIEGKNNRPNFLPTCKLSKKINRENTCKYGNDLSRCYEVKYKDGNRLPSWCDRILYMYYEK